MRDTVWICMTTTGAKIWGYQTYCSKAEFEYQRDVWDVIYFYGTVGQVMDKLRQHKKYELTTGDLLDELHEKVNNKEHNGYFKFPNSRYFELAREGHLIQLLIEISKEYYRTHTIYKHTPKFWNAEEDLRKIQFEKLLNNIQVEE